MCVCVGVGVGVSVQVVCKSACLVYMLAQVGQYDISI